MFDARSFTISRDDSTYECFPSLTRCKDGRIVLVYRESDGHKARKYSRLIVRASDDNGQTFSDRKVLIATEHKDGALLKYNCAKVQQLSDGSLLVACDRFPIPPGEMTKGGDESRIVFFTSSDNGDTWSEPRDTGIRGIMPDEVVELPDGDWLLATQFRPADLGCIAQCVSRSSDKGKTWDSPTVIAACKPLHLCEASIVRLPIGELVCYMRENSGKGLPVFKSFSHDGGKTWEGPFETMMGGGHRPVAHMTHSGKVLITYRHQPGSHTVWAKNTFAFMEPIESALEKNRDKQTGIVLPLDHDRSPASDGGYTGWVETAPGEFVIANYIVDDAPKAQIRGYRVRETDF
jgi:hypothetical protein